jgi:hypothetical protein
MDVKQGVPPSDCLPEPMKESPFMSVRHTRNAHWLGLSEGKIRHCFPGMASASAAAAAASSGDSAEALHGQEAGAGSLREGRPGGIGDSASSRSTVASIQRRYRGPALLSRLSFLAETSAALRSEAFDAAISASKALGTNLQQYKALCEAAGRDPDAEWLATATSRQAARFSHMERELNLQLASQTRDKVQVSGGAGWRNGFPNVRGCRSATRTWRCIFWRTARLGTP